MSLYPAFGQDSGPLQVISQQPSRGELKCLFLLPARWPLTRVVERPWILAERRVEDDIIKGMGRCRNGKEAMQCEKVGRVGGNIGIWQSEEAYTHMHCSPVRPSIDHQPDPNSPFLPPGPPPDPASQCFLLPSIVCICASPFLVEIVRTAMVPQHLYNYPGFHVLKYYYRARWRKAETQPWNKYANISRQSDSSDSCAL